MNPNRGLILADWLRNVVIRYHFVILEGFIKGFFFFFSLSRSMWMCFFKSDDCIVKEEGYKKRKEKDKEAESWEKKKKKKGRRRRR